MSLFKKKRKFPFSDSPDTACFTCCHIISGQRKIRFVSHDDEDGCWQFLCGEEDEEEDARVVSLQEILQIDESIASLSQMDYGCFAEYSEDRNGWVIGRDSD